MRVKKILGIVTVLSFTMLFPSFVNAEVNSVEQEIYNEAASRTWTFDLTEIEGVRGKYALGPKGLEMLWEALDDSSVNLADKEKGKHTMLYDPNVGLVAKLKDKNADDVRRWIAEDRIVCLESYEEPATTEKPIEPTTTATEPTTTEETKPTTTAIEPTTTVGTVKPQIVGHTNTVTISKGDKIAIMKAPVGLNAGTVKYTSNNTKVVSITKSGSTYYANAIKTGTATIKAIGTELGVENGILKVTVVKNGTKTTKVSFIPNDKTLYMGQKVKTKINTTPNNASKMMSYTSNNTKVATVSSNGLIIGKAGGTATITATAKDGSKKKSSVKITVTSIKLSGKSKVMTVGDKVTASSYFVFTPTTAADGVVYSSDNENVVKVENGELLAVNAGKANITVKTRNGSGLTKKYSFSVKEKAVLTKATFKSSINPNELIEVKFGNFSWESNDEFNERLMGFLTKTQDAFGDDATCTFIRNGQKYTAKVENNILELRDETGNAVNIQEFLVSGEMNASDLAITIHVSSLPTLVSYMQTAQNLGSELSYHGFVMSDVDFLGYNLKFNSISEVTIKYIETEENYDYKFYVQDGAFYFDGDVMKSTPEMAERVKADFFDLTLVDKE